MKFAILVLATGLSISAVAAFFSITGLMAIFQSLPISVQVMAGVLEIGKLVTAAWIHRNWTLTDVKKKVFGVLSVIALMLITSIGIFGYLTKAHVGTGQELSQNNNKIERIEQKIQSEQREIDRAEKILQQLDESIDEYIDRGYITRGLEKREEQEEDRNQQKENIRESEEAMDDLRNELQSAKGKVSQVEVEVGPAKQVAKVIYGQDDEESLEKAVQLIIFIIMFAFDPLAVMMLLMQQEEFEKRQRERNTVDDNKPLASIDALNEFARQTQTESEETAKEEPEESQGKQNTGSKSNYDLEKYQGRRPPKY